ncbi:MAG: metallophosphoesterase [Acidobacteriaceae bacterium]|nr:metallophosphoesterase [Acidobacteriaceae bacterium]
MHDVWFTSDFHFGHFNIIRYCKRPFGSIEEMDDALAEGVNSCVKPDDVLYYLGDFCLGEATKITAYRKRLACKTIHFIEGNHDRAARKLRNLFASWEVLSQINVAGQRIVLCHYAMRVWPHHVQGAWHLYGHSHGNLPDDAQALSLDVGVDGHNYRPWHFEEIQTLMQMKVVAR